MFIRLSLSIALSASAFFATNAWSEEKDPLQIYVSKDSQSLVVYDGDQVVTSSKVSTGKPGHTTPSGIFSILEKQKTHYSNLYDSAPMPFMQRLTWSGVALHESGHVPDYPASHGCVRMPGKFAKMLFGMTQRGFHVVISDRDVAPRKLDDQALFKPRFPKPEGELLSDAELRPAMIDSTRPIEVAMAEALPKAGAVAVAKMPEEVAPVRILITRASERARIRDIQTQLDRLGYEPGAIDGLLSKSTRAAIKAYQDRHGQKADGQPTEAFVTSLYKVMNRKPLTGWLYVRRNFKPVFDQAVDIDRPDIALGTHFYTALHVNAAQNSVSWYGTSLDNHISDKAAKRLGITTPADPLVPDAAEAAFSRVTIPGALRTKLETMLGNGSTMTVTDTGTDSETGQGTDFITVTRKAG